MATSVWQLLPDADDNFRWELSSQGIQTPAISDGGDSTPLFLPSFDDGLLQGCSLIVEDSELDEPEVERIPKRQIASTNFDRNRNDSTVKASSLLDHEFTKIGAGKQSSIGDEFTSPNSMFQTGAGNMVRVSLAGIKRAKALLGVHDNNDDHCTFQDYEPAKKKLVGNSRNAFGQQCRDMAVNAAQTENSSLSTKVPLHLGINSSGNEFDDAPIGQFLQPEIYCSTKTPPIEFHTAGGRSISVSSEALHRARNLLGNPDMSEFPNEGDSGALMFSFSKNNDSSRNNFDKQHNTDSSLSHCQFEMTQQSPQKFVSPLRSSLKRKQSGAKPMVTGSRSNLISKFDAEAPVCNSNVKPSGMTIKPSTFNDLHMKGPLADRTNTVGVDSANKKGTALDLKKVGRRPSVSPFKMPRSSKFVTPLNNRLTSAPTGSLSRVFEGSCSRKQVSTRYPIQLSRTYVQEFFGVPPTQPKMELLPEKVRLMNPANSKNYTFYNGSQIIDVEAFYHMLAQSGASMQNASKEWVANHYKWIVWKLASYERCYSAKFLMRFLTISNVLHELKYRYEREVNHCHRSAIRRILEGDAPPSSMLVLCVSAICSASEIDTCSANRTAQGSFARVQLTDGWYSIEAQLDALLSNYLAVGKLFLGQKLRICGASLIGWNGPVSPLDASQTVNLLLHINGTYRVGWAERLGFCRGACPPLAFRCIKSNGGPIPWTLVGVTRVYPVLYRERLKGGRFIVRSEKMEAAVIQLFNQRRSNIAEGIMSDFERGGNDSYIADDQDKEEGARIWKMLESVAEPEYLMADMSVEELKTLSNYQEKILARKQSDMQRMIEKAVEDAGLHARDVTPFIRVRVVGLTNKDESRGKDPIEGLIRIWNPTEKQKLELAEGKAYTVSGLVPFHSDSNTLHLEARGSSTTWQPLSKNEVESFVPFFNPRKPVSLSVISEVPLSSEFDTVGLVVHVGMDYISGQQKKQWVFVTDGSLCQSQNEVSISILAISFSSPSTKDDSLSPFNNNLVGSVVGFCNLVKRARDHANQMWVADASENAAYCLNCDNPSSSSCNFKNAFASVKRWQQNSSMMINRLREKIIYIIGCSLGSSAKTSC